MDINTKITRVEPEDIAVGKWAGGVTKQIAIWPPDAEYAKRDFKWRLSSATVDLEKSTFTSLPGFHRILMILDGAVELTYTTPSGARHKHLGAFESDSFEGSWDTTSLGCCVDFNLMFAEGCDGSLCVLRDTHSDGTLSPLDIFSRSRDVPCLVTEAFYCLADSFSYRFEEGEFSASATMRKGGALLLARAFPEAEPGRGVKFEIGADSGGGEWGVRATIVSPF
jgi:hypothetical protein